MTIVENIDKLLIEWVYEYLKSKNSRTAEIFAEELHINTNKITLRDTSRFETWISFFMCREYAIHRNNMENKIAEKDKRMNRYINSIKHEINRMHQFQGSDMPMLTLQTYSEAKNKHLNNNCKSQMHHTKTEIVETPSRMHRLYLEMEQKFRNSNFNQSGFTNNSQSSMHHHRPIQQHPNLPTQGQDNIPNYSPSASITNSQNTYKHPSQQPILTKLLEDASGHSQSVNPDYNQSEDTANTINQQHISQISNNLDPHQSGLHNHVTLPQQQMISNVDSSQQSTSVIDTEYQYPQDKNSNQPKISNTPKKRKLKKSNISEKSNNNIASNSSN